MARPRAAHNRWMFEALIFRGSAWRAPAAQGAGGRAALLALALAATLTGCSTRPLPAPFYENAPAFAPDPQDTGPLPAPIVRGRSRWVPVRWAELPGFWQDDTHPAWSAWLKSCERPGPAFASLCDEVRRLTLASVEEQKQWMRERLRPYRVETLNGTGDQGLLTSYYEPLVQASRQSRPGFTVPLHRPPSGVNGRGTWYSRQDMDQLPQARAALAGQEIVWLADPIDALILQIQGSGRAQVSEPDGSQRTVRLAYAATNGHPYKSVGRWLLDQGEVTDATWPGIKAWLAQNPHRQQELLWSNPRVTFFREEALNDVDMHFGPRGAQGVPLTPGRSIAVDPQSIPYGTPVWISSTGPQAQLNRLVMAQDTGSAITGAVRADFFAGSGQEAGELAGRLKQPLRMWVLWPR